MIIEGQEISESAESGEFIKVVSALDLIEVLLC
jgi:hypothetical protein